MLESSIKFVTYINFSQLWRLLLPSMVVTELCWQFQKNHTTILRISNNADVVKSMAYEDTLE